MHFGMLNFDVMWFVFSAVELTRSRQIFYVSCELSNQQSFLQDFTFSKFLDDVAPIWCDNFSNLTKQLQNEWRHWRKTLCNCVLILLTNVFNFLLFVFRFSSALEANAIIKIQVLICRKLTRSNVYSIFQVHIPHTKLQLTCAMTHFFRAIPFCIRFSFLSLFFFFSFFFIILFFFSYWKSNRLHTQCMSRMYVRSRT